MTKFLIDGNEIIVTHEKKEIRTAIIKESEEQEMQQQSELKQIIESLNTDKLNEEGMTSLDLNTALNSYEKSAYHRFDSLIAGNFLAKTESIISRIGKRLNVSMERKGRKDIIEVVGRSQDNRKALVEKLGLKVQ